MDLTPEENNFLVAVHALSNSVYPVIRKEFDRLCPYQELEKIRMDMYEQHNAQYYYDSHKDGRKSIKKRIYLTQIQQQQLFSPKQEESKNIDLELMIYILKRRIEEEYKQDSVGQLEVIDNIRKEIFQSSSGVLNETRFQDMIKSIREAVVHFGGEFYEDKVINIHQIQNINFLKSPFCGRFCRFCIKHQHEICILFLTRVLKEDVAIFSWYEVVAKMILLSVAIVSQKSVSVTSLEHYFERPNNVRSCKKKDQKVMTLKNKICCCTFAFTCLFILTFMVFAESYNFECPSHASWKLRAHLKCNNTWKYFCLYNNVEGKYVEGCNGPDWDRKGSKRIYAGDFSRGKCLRNRFQPFSYWTNGSVSDCIFVKSTCSAEGQVVYKDNSSKEDTACRCDNVKNYSFIKNPKHICFCIPSQEDCSCYIKSCPVNYTLSAGYSCIQNNFKEETKCSDITKFNKTSKENICVLRIFCRFNKTSEENTIVYMGNNLFSKTTSTLKSSTRTAASILLCICIILTIGICMCAILFHVWTSEKLQPLKKYIQGKQKGLFMSVLSPKCFGEHDGIVRSKADGDKGTSVEVNDIVYRESDETCESKSVQKQYNNVSSRVRNVRVEVHRSVNLGELATDEVHFLRLIHLLFRVTCPVVRMIFNYEIQPDQLRKILDKNKLKMLIRYRKKDAIIHDLQWGLLYGRQDTATSDDFDLRLMTYLMSTLTNIDVGDLYPVESDTRVGAMLSRIKFITNETTQNLEGKLSEDLFNQHWDDIGQAVLKLVSFCELNVENDQEKMRLIDRLHVLNPIDIDDKTLRIFIYMSEIFPAMILQQLISEYCTSKQITIEDLLKEAKHQLHHKRKKADICCTCKTELSSNYKPISEKDWKAFYEINKSSDSHFCKSNPRNCSESFVPKSIYTGDLSVAKVLILNIPYILTYMISRLCVNGFDTFLLQNKHTLYHSMEAKLCCKCNTLSSENTERSFISINEWNKLFIKDVIACQSSYKDCYCQYSVRKGTKQSDIDDTLLSKIFHVAGPIYILNKIEQDPLLYFLNWTVDDQPLRSALIDLVNMIEDRKFSGSVTSFILPRSDVTIANQKDTRMWISKHLRPHKARTEQQLQILVHNEDGLNVKSVQIPKGFSLPLRTKTITDLTTEENNFLVVVYGLIKIIYPLIKTEFETQCPDYVFDEIRVGIFKQSIENNGSDEKHNNRDKRMRLTQVQRQLFSRTREEIKNFDFELMVNILKKRLNYKWNSEYINQINIIEKIRREIVYSSSGILNHSNFKDIMTRINKAVSYFGGEIYMKDLTRLEHIHNILE
ncbi:unnamed protein product [Mytilus coruscus]|uniref:DZIP3-like HEPN domain-containing protein n=1 Tax=Mytilus coruscus TaxID=42192 RepID=A0A6J8DRZ1_MYTCO|nr:unnamed protein product [Mytilus coruscus]